MESWAEMQWVDSQNRPRFGGWAGLRCNEIFKISAYFSRMTGWAGQCQAVGVSAGLFVSNLGNESKSELIPLCGGPFQD